MDIVWNGETITQPGIYASVPINQYHRDPKMLDGIGISSTNIRAIARRPSEFWCTSIYNSACVEEDTDEETKDQIFGRAAHHLLLGEADFRGHFAIKPSKLDGKPWNGNRTECRDWLKARSAEGVAVISQADMDRIRRIHDSLAKHPIVAAGSINGRVERSMFARLGGIWLKARPDVIPSDSGDFVDLKTARAVDDDSLSRAIFSSGYHVQAAVVRMVWRELGYDFGAFVLAFLEKTAPFEVRLFEVRTQDIDLGERQARAALATAGECLKRGVWPGYDGWDPSVLNIDIPAWARTRAEADLARREAA